MRTITDCLKEFRATKETNPVFDNINLSNIDFAAESADQIQALAQEIASNPQLTHIGLARTKLGLVTDVTKMQPLFVAIKQNQQLVSIDLSNNELNKATPNLWQLLTETLAQDSHIKQLDLNGNKLGGSLAENSQHIQTFLLGVLQGLEKLDLTDNCLSADLLNMITTGINRSRCLTDLNISLNNLGNIEPIAVLIVFLTAIKDKQSLTALDFSDNALELVDIDNTPTCLQLLAQTAQHLISLEMAGNNLADAGVEELNSNFFSVISSSTTLQFLGLSNNGFGLLLETETQLTDCIIAFLQQNRSLTAINLKNNNIPRPVQQRIVDEVSGKQQLKITLDFKIELSLPQHTTTVFQGGGMFYAQIPTLPRLKDIGLLQQMQILIITYNPELLDEMSGAETPEIKKLEQMLKSIPSQQVATP